MELKNIIAAVALSIAIIVLYTLFFQPSPEELNQIREQKENNCEKQKRKSISDLFFNFEPEN